MDITASQSGYSTMYYKMQQSILGQNASLKLYDLFFCGCIIIANRDPDQRPKGISLNKLHWRQSRICFFIVLLFIPFIEVSSGVLYL